MKILFSFCILLLSINCQSAVLINNKLWNKGTVLNVVFINGTKMQHRLVQKIAPQWLTNTSLSFKFFNSFSEAPNKTHIRINFQSINGSQLGNHQDYFSKRTTMNLFDLTSNQISESTAQRIILHEFGHALGFEHEYRSHHWPYGTNAFDKIILNCIPKMKQIGYILQLAREKCKDINSPIQALGSLTTAYDEMSIMSYPLSFILENGLTKYIKPHSKLSHLDKYAMQRWYSK